MTRHRLIHVMVPRLIPALAFVSLLVVSAAAQIVPLQPPRELKRMSVEELLQQEVLSVTHRPATLGQAPSSVFLIRGESARTTGATSLPEMLRSAPNLFVAQVSASDWAVGARGFTRATGRVDKLLVLIDGRTVYSPLFSGVFWDAQDVFLPDLDRIEVISGPAGATWGANAVNGVINITSKSARETQGGLVYAGFGSELTFDAGLRYGGSLGGGEYYRVYAKRSSYDDSLAANGDDPGQDGWHFSQAGFRLDGASDRSAVEWTVQGDAYAGRHDHPDGQGARNEGANLLARWTAHLAEDAGLVVRLYHDYTKRDRPGTYTDFLRTTDLEVQYQMARGRHHRFLFGAAYRLMNEHIDSESPTFAIRPADVLMHLGGIFMQDEMIFWEDRIRLTTGLRLENNGFTGWEMQPSARLAWVLRPEHTVWTAISRATRTPSRVDNDFFAPAEPPFTLVPADDFRSEILLAYELGWRGSLGRGIAASVTGFYHDYDRLRSVELGQPLRIANDLVGRSYGAEFFLDWEWTKMWRWRFGYFSQRQAVTSRPGSTDLEGGRGEASRPDEQLHVRTVIDLRPEVSLWLALRSVGRVPAFVNGLDAGAVPAYSELDASVRWNVRPGLELSLSGRNLLHRAHPEIGAAATRQQIQRSFHTAIRWEF